MCALVAERMCVRKQRHRPNDVRAVVYVGPTTRLQAKRVFLDVRGRGGVNTKYVSAVFF